MVFWAADESSFLGAGRRLETFMHLLPVGYRNINTCRSASRRFIRVRGKRA